MSKYVIMPITPSPIPSGRFAQNGDIPSSSVLRRVATAYNYVSASQRKLVHLFSVAPDDTWEPTNNSARGNYFLFRTGENVEAIEVIIGMAHAVATNGNNPAHCKLELYDGTNTLATAKMLYPKVDTSVAAYVPSDIHWATARVTASDGLLPNTLYRGSLLQVNRSRLHSIMVHEIASDVTDSSVDGVCNPLSWEANRPINDSAAQDLAETGTKLWRHNGAQLLSHGAQYEPIVGYFAFTVSGTTWSNIIRSTDSAYGANTPGFILNTQYHDTAKLGVPVQLAVYATRTSGTTGTLEIKLEQSGPSTWLTETGIASASSPFHTSDHVVTAQASTKTDILARCSNGDTWRIDAIGLWEYEA